MAKGRNPDRVRVAHKAVRHMRTYADLWHGVKFMIGIAKENELGSTYKCMSALIMLAFTVEAYANYVGPAVIGEAWEAGDKPVERFSPTAKIVAIGKNLGVEVDYGRVPWQRIREIFNVRNMLAHAKRMDVSPGEKIISIPQDELGEFNFPNVASPWQRFCTVEYIEKALLDVESALRTIHEALDDEDYDKHGALFVMGMTIGSMSVLPDADSQ